MAALHCEGDWAPAREVRERRAALRRSLYCILRFVGCGDWFGCGGG